MQYNLIKPSQSWGLWKQGSIVSIWTFFKNDSICFEILGWNWVYLILYSMKEAGCAVLGYILGVVSHVECVMSHVTWWCFLCPPTVVCMLQLIGFCNINCMWKILKVSDVIWKVRCRPWGIKGWETCGMSWLFQIKHGGYVSLTRVMERKTCVSIEVPYGVIEGLPSAGCWKLT